ncbi:exosortase/archaeosortase family protein [Puniceicoccaceae bacterium K14]|nr:exosortase/archaeosortase family protein [Puniceicoccaceae bacterium K14]
MLVVLLSSFSVFISWLILYIQLSYSWGGDSSYSYGWLVGPMTFFLLWQRLFREKRKMDGQFHFGGAFICIGTLILAVLSSVLIEVNPFWRLPLWSATLSLIGTSLSLLYLIGGRAWVVNSIIPFVFLLTMVPWPTFVERPVILKLTGAVSYFVVEVLQLLEYPAIAYGNVIRVGELLVGVEEACSGIKSLQALLMMALFVGEFWRLKFAGRWILLVWAVALTMTFNFARALSLSLIVLRGGGDLFDKWHDTLGYLALGGGMLALFFVASKLSSASEENVNEKRSCDSEKCRVIPFWFAAVLFILAISPPALSKLWYDDSLQESVPLYNWYYEFGTTEFEVGYSIREEEVPKRVSDILAFDYGTRLVLTSPDSTFHVEGWYYGYTGERKSDSLGAFAHSPNVCMQATGAIQVGDGVDFPIDVGSFDMPFKHFVFEMPDETIMQVFWCLWDDIYDGNQLERIGTDVNNSKLSAQEKSRFVKFVNAFQGRRSFKRKVLLLGFREENNEQALVLAKELVRGLVTVEKDGEVVKF